MRSASLRLTVVLVVAIAAIAGIVALALHGRKGTPSPAADASLTTDKISIQSFAFLPGITRVKVGATVTWTNLDSIGHTVTVDSGTGPSSGTLQRGQSYSYTFTQAGSYAYHCSIHPEMRGTIVVQ